MKKIIFLIMGLLIGGCCLNSLPQEPPKTQLEIREFQTRTYDTDDVKMLMKAMINVLQDDGFIVKNANIDLGLLTATKEVDIENKTEAFWASLLLEKDARWKKNAVIDTSANISEYGNQCRVRINFQIKEIDNVGSVIQVKQIDGAEYYQEFFSKVDKGVFIQKENL